VVVAYWAGKFPGHFFIHFLWLLKSIYSLPLVGKTMNYSTPEMDSNWRGSDHILLCVPKYRRCGSEACLRLPGILPMQYSSQVGRRVGGIGNLIKKSQSNGR
jgi:hypothetical protein